MRLLYADDDDDDDDDDDVDDDDDDDDDGDDRQNRYCKQDDIFTTHARRDQCCLEGLGWRLHRNGDWPSLQV